MDGDRTALELPGLHIGLVARPSWFDRFVDVHIGVDAHPFTGRLEGTLTDEDLSTFATRLDALDPVGEAVLGGDRALELRLAVDHIEPRPVDGPGLAVTCSLTPSGDDPDPQLTWTILGVGPFAATFAARCRSLAALDPWPRPPSLPTSDRNS